MPHLTNDHWVKLYYEDTSKGIQIIFIHEFLPTCRSCFWRQTPVDFGNKHYQIPGIHL